MGRRNGGKIRKGDVELGWMMMDIELGGGRVSDIGQSLVYGLSVIFALELGHCGPPHPTSFVCPRYV